MKINAPQYVRTEGVVLDKKAENILLPSFLCCVIGKPGSGKTYLVNQLFTDRRFYGERFDEVLFIGPTRYEGVEHDTENTSRDLDMKWILSRLEDFNQELRPTNILLIMDDVVSEVSKSSNLESFKSLIFNRRHLLKHEGSLSILITSQKYMSLPNLVRNCIDMCFVFRINSNDSKCLVDEVSSSVSKARLVELIENLNQHQFLFINNRNGKVYNEEFNQV